MTTEFDHLLKERNIVSLASKDPTQIDAWERILIKASEHLSLTEPQYKLICDRYETLQGILNASTDPILRDAHIFVQGSIGLQTTIKPASNATGEMATIDADAIILLPYVGSATSEQVLMAIEKRFRDASRVDAPIKPLRRGIRMVYADENPGFHMDITPARTCSGNTDNKGYGFLDVPDRVTGWKGSSPRTYSQWLESISQQQIKIAMDRSESIALAEATQDPMPHYDKYASGNPLRVAIKLIKRSRDEWAITSRKIDVRPISAILTTLAALAYQEVVQESRYQEIRAIDAIFKIVQKMPKFIRIMNGEFKVLNPIDSRENFAEKWNRPHGEGYAYARAFFDWYSAACDAFSVGFIQADTPKQLEDALLMKFGIPVSRTQDWMSTTPRNWTLPGRRAGVTLNTISTAGLLGSGYAQAKSQASIEPVRRLG